MTVNAAVAAPTHFEAAYDPARVLKSKEFRVLNADDAALADKEANIACAYNPAHEVHIINKPVPTPREGEVIVHVKSTGICG